MRAAGRARRAGAPAVEAKPAISADERGRRVRARIALGAAALVTILSLFVSASPPAGAYVAIVETTPAYSNEGEVLWSAAPGEQYSVLEQDGEWVLARSEFPPGSAWFMQGANMRMESDPSRWRQRVESFASRVSRLLEAAFPG